MLLSSVQDQPLDLYFHAGHAGFDPEGEREERAHHSDDGQGVAKRDVSGEVHIIFPLCFACTPYSPSLVCRQSLFRPRNFSGSGGCWCKAIVTDRTEQPYTGCLRRCQ